MRDASKAMVQPGLQPWWGWGLGLLIATMLLLSPGQAHLPDRFMADADMPGLESVPHRQRVMVMSPLRSRFAATNWRCQAICDDSGHLRQSCLMLSDPQLSGLGQALDHLSKSGSNLKSLGDLGLAVTYDSQTC